MKIITLIIVICCLIFILPYNIFADTKIQQYFLSPSGKYKIIFTELEHRRFSKPARDIDEKNHVVYRIDFLDKNSNVLLTSTVYSDVYGWPEEDSKPTPVAYLFEMMTWSPKDDIIILPEEDWPSAPGTVMREVRAINPKLSWKESRFEFDKFFWIDDFSGIGDRHGDCRYEVMKFDGITGKDVSIKSSESPIGYELILLNKNKVMIRQVTDNCSEKSQPPVCFWYDLTTQKENRVPCPVEKSKPPKKITGTPTKATKKRQ